MAITTKGVASWGISNGLQGGTTIVSGIVTDYDQNVEAIMAEEQNEIGQVIKKIIYDTRKTITVTVLVDDGTDLPKVGAACTIDGVSAYVTTTRLLESNVNYRKISFTAEAYLNCTTATNVTNNTSEVG